MFYCYEGKLYNSFNPMLDITMKYIHIMLMYILMSILFSASKPVHPNTIKRL